MTGILRRPGLRRCFEWRYNAAPIERPREIVLGPFCNIAVLHTPFDIDCYSRARTRLIRDGLQDAKRWCVGPDTFVDGRRSDQFWLKQFSSAEQVTAQIVHAFLVGFQLTNRVKWNKERVATAINDLGRTKEITAPNRVSELATQLSNCIESKNRGRQTSAASKILFFAEPNQEIYIWDKFANCSARFREWRRGGGSGICRARALYKTPSGAHDYEAFYRCCSRILCEERKSLDFVRAAKGFGDYLVKVGGPMARSESRRNSSFVERRLLDKIMFWEGKWLHTADAAPAN